MKLRYFYILCFLVSIEWSFCYEYINNEKETRPHGSVKRNAKSKHGRQKNQHRRTRRQEYEEEKDPVASIDIASFIQQPDPDYESVEDHNHYKNKRRSSRFYDDFDSLNDMQMSLENGDQQLRNDLEDSNILYGEKLSDISKLKNSFVADQRSKKENSAKIPRRRQAIPFFSRNKKEKKYEKRNFFNFGFKSTSMTTLLPKCAGPKPDLKNQFNKLVKRSNFDRYCPLCKRKIVPKDKKSKKAPRKNIHNSRQYYKAVGDITQKKQNMAASNDFQGNKIGYDLNLKGNMGTGNEGSREKRDYDEEYDTRESQHSKRGDKGDSLDSGGDAIRERQLHELEALQKKIDSLEIHFPNQKVDKKIRR